MAKATGPTDRPRGWRAYRREVQFLVLFVLLLGGGFALMTEAVGMAGMLETPVVCVDVQRGGPATGIPTSFSPTRAG